MMAAVLEALRDRRLYREGAAPLLERALATGEAVEELIPRPSDDDGLALQAAAVAAGLVGPRFRDSGRRMRRAMGLLMADWRGRVAGSEAAKAMAAALAEVIP